MNNKLHYFNKAALVHISVILFIYMAVDLYLVDYAADNNAFSKSFYAKLVIVIIYFAGSKPGSISASTENPLDSAFHFSVVAFCLWLGIASITLSSVSLSGYFGIFLIFGGLGVFNLIDELLKLLRVQMTAYPKTLAVIEAISKIMLFSVFLLALFFLILGQWVWEVKPFYEW